MGLFRRIFGLPDGQKALQIVNSSGIEEVLDGWPSWPVFDSYGAMYRKQPAVRTVVDFLARNMAQLNPKIYMRVDDVDRVEWNDHPVAELLRNPNPTTTRYAHLRDTVSDIAIYDRAYWRKMRSRGLIRALVRIPPSRLVIEFDQDRQRNVYRLNGEVISRDELVIFHGYHPDGNEVGVSPLETLRRVLSEEWAAQTNREWFWRNAARQSGVIERPLEAPEWSQTARSQFRDQWQGAMAGGSNSGKTAVLEEGMKWNPSSFSPKDAMYIEGRKLTYEEVARVYAPSLVGLLGADGQKANVESYHRQLYQDVLAPYCRMVQDEIDGQLLTLPEFDFGVSAYTEFNLREKLKGSFVEELDALTKAVGVPHMSINEARARQNLTRIDADWADVPVQPMNIIYGGQPAVNVPIGGGESSSDFAAKLAGFFDRQRRTLVPRLGAVKGRIPDDLWQMDRWLSELTEIYAAEMPAVEALKTAAIVLATHRFRIAEAFRSGGLQAVNSVFDGAVESVTPLALSQ